MRLSDLSDLSEPLIFIFRSLRLPGGGGNSLQIPASSRQRSKSDSNVSYTAEVVMLETKINTKTYTSPQPQEDLTLPLPPRVRVIQRSPSPSRRNTVAGNILSLSDFQQAAQQATQQATTYQQKKMSLPTGYLLCPEIVISDHDTRGVEETHRPAPAYFNPDTPESDQSSQSGDLFQEVLGELDTPLDGMMDPGSVNAFFENLNINSNQTENQSSNLTTLTSPPSFNFEASRDLTNQGEFSMSPTYHPSISPEFVVNNPPEQTVAVATTDSDQGLEAEIMRFLQDGSK